MKNKLKPIEQVTTAEEARSIAVEWQHAFADANHSWASLANDGDYFELLAQKFPELRDEFKENGIL